MPDGGAGIAKGRAGPQGVQGAWQEGISPGMLIFWSGGSRGLKIWFLSTVQSIKPVEITDFAVTPLPSLIMAFLMSFMQKISPNNAFLLLFSSSALLQHVGIPHTFL